jgi:hypothetical protein
VLEVVSDDANRNFDGNDLQTGVVVTSKVGVSVNANSTVRSVLVSL